MIYNQFKWQIQHYSIQAKHVFVKLLCCREGMVIKLFSCSLKMCLMPITKYVT